MLRIVLAALVFFPLAASAQKTEEDKNLYAIGYLVGQRSVQSMSLSKAQLKTVEQGFHDGASGAKAKVDPTERQQAISEFARGRQEAAAAKVVGPEKAEGKEFADKAAKEPGAERLPSGLVIKQLKPGTGETPKATDTVKVNYEGKLTNGTVFDSSYKRGQPAEFPLNGVIKCWTEGVAKMKVGEEAQLVCPSDIAYGDHGRPPQIPPGATLVFKVELLSIGGGTASSATPK